MSCWLAKLQHILARERERHAICRHIVMYACTYNTRSARRCLYWYVVMMRAHARPRNVFIAAHRRRRSLSELGARARVRVHCLSGCQARLHADVSQCLFDINSRAQRVIYTRARLMQKANARTFVPGERGFLSESGIAYFATSGKVLSSHITIIESELCAGLVN